MMSLSAQHIALGISAANFVLTWGVALYMYFVNKNKATNERIGQLERDIDHTLDSHAARIARLEGLAEKAPTHDDLGKLYAKVNSTAEDVAEIAGELKGINANLRLILNRVAEKGL